MKKEYGFMGKGSSLKFKLSAISNTIAILALIILGITSFYFTKNALLDSVIAAETNYMSSAKNSIENFDGINIRAVTKLENSILSLPYEKLNSQENIEHNVGSILKNFKDGGSFLAVYIGFESGDKIASDPNSDKKNIELSKSGPSINGYDARKRGWYIEANKNPNKIYTTPIYIDSVTNLPCFTYAKALYKDGKYIGTLAIDKLVTDLQEEFNRLPGRTFAFDSQDAIFASSDPKFEGKNPDIAILQKEWTKVGDNNIFYYTGNDNIKRFAICTKVNYYTACIAESLDVINAPVAKMAYIQVIIVLIIVVLSIILLYFIVSRYLSPLSSIQSGLNSFFDFINHKTKNIATIDVKTNDEFG
ncbi:cache domain-containing protein, partial [Campylobacter sp. VTCC 70190]|uniref:cache domain-containing protein n=1 Tax=Campylobacter sp. VTCC 70190 TaxID=3392118 RepID=UPI00398E3D05